MHGKVARPAVPLATCNIMHRAVDSADLLLLFITPEGSTSHDTITKIGKKHKKLKTNIHKNIRNYKTHHRANEIMVHAPVHNSFLEWLPDMQFDFKVRSERKWTVVITLGS